MVAGTAARSTLVSAVQIYIHCNNAILLLIKAKACCSLHTWNSNLRNKRFRRARAIFAQFCGRLTSRVPQWLLKRL